MWTPNAFSRWLKNRRTGQTYRKPERRTKADLAVDRLEDRNLMATAIGLNGTNDLVRFDTATPGTIQATTPITGLVAGDIMNAIDFRPATGQLYGFAFVNATTFRLYTINTTTGAATQVGGNITVPVSGVGGGYEIDFNPTVDRIRVTSSNNDNFRLNPNDGSIAGTDTPLSATGVEGTAYDRNFGGASTTTLYGINSTTDQLVTIGGLNGTPSPNGGVVSVVGNLGFDTADGFSFDIDSGSSTGFAILDVAGVRGLFSINLATGAATSLGALGGNPSFFSMAIQPTAINVAGTAGADVLTITATGPNSGTYSISTVNGGAAIPFTGITSFTFNGGASDDTLVLNAPAGSNFSPTGGIFFNGGTGANTVTINGNTSDDTLTVNATGFDSGSASLNGSSLLTYSGTGTINFNGGTGADALVIQNGTHNTTTYNYTNATDGNIDLDVDGPGGVAAQKINYTGLSPITNTGNATNVIFNLPAGTDVATLADDGNAGNGLNTLSSAPTTFESTTFANPVAGGSVTINTTGGTDTLNVNALDNGFATNAVRLTLNGTGAQNTFNVNGATLRGTLSINGNGGGDSATVTNTTVTNALANGLAIDSVSTITITGGTYNTNADDGIMLSNFTTATVTNVTANGNTGGAADGLEVNGGTTLTVTGGTFSNNADNGFDLFNATNVTITGSSVNGNTNQGILLFVATTTTISDLTLVGNGLNSVVSSTTINFTGTTGNTRDIITVSPTTIQHTRAPATVNDTINYTATNLNLFADGGNDTVIVNVQGGFGATNLAIQGGANDATNRDNVVINDGRNAANIGLAYVLGGGVDVTGIANNAAVIRTTETVSYVNTTNTAVAAVTGTTADEEFTVAPVGANRTLVFNGGDPWSGPSEDANPFDQFPGVASTVASTAPDLDLAGLSGAGNGFTINAGTGTNRLFIYTPGTVQSLSTGVAVDYFGFGNGVLIPSAAAAGLGSGFDNITALGNTDFVEVVTNRNVAPITLLRTNFNAASLSLNQLAFGPDPRLIVNTGFEAGVAGDGRADIVTTSGRNDFQTRFNGGRPTPTVDGNVPPVGDQIFFAAPRVDVWSDQSFPTNVSVVTVGAGGLQPVDYTDFEDVAINAATLNIFGDNNTPGVVQNDEYIITGTAANAFNLIINRSSPIRVTGVVNLNVFGAHNEAALADATGTGQADPNSGADRIAITPFAALPATQWGINVIVDSGAEPLADADRLSYSGVAGIVNRITLDADATGPGTGRIYDPNIVLAPIVDPNGLAVRFSRTENVNINANSGDNDSLVIQTTQAVDDVTLRFDPDRTGGKPGGFTSVPQDLLQDDIRILNRFDVVIDDGRGLTNPADGTSILDTPIADGFKAVTINTREGDDTIRVNLVAAGNDNDAAGAGAGTIPINVVINASAPQASDTLIVVGNNGLNDTFTVTPGADPQSGEAAIAGTDTGTVTFTGIEAITLLGNGGAGTDSVVLNGTGADDAFTLNATAALSGTARVGANPTITFTNLGTAASTVVLNGAGGSDSFSVTPLANWGLGQVTVNGGDPTGSDTAVVNATAATDTLNYTPSAADGGTLTGTGLPPVVLVGVEHFILNGLGGNDALTVTGAAGDDRFVHTPGEARDAGTMQVGSLLAVNYRNLGVTGSVTADGLGGTDTLNIRGTNDGDNINVSFPAANSISVSIDAAAGVHIPVRSAAVESYIIDSAQNGFDDIFLDTPINATGDVFILGGGASDTLHLTANATVTAVTVSTPSPVVAANVFHRITGFGTTFEFGEIDGVNYTAIGAETFTVNPGPGDNTVRVQGAGPAGNTLVTSDTLPPIEFSAVTTFTVDGGGGSDQLIVEATQGADNITVTGTTVMVNGLLPVNYANTERLAVNGLAGVDTFTVTTSAAVPYFLDGGDPSGANGDRLIFNATATSTFQAGPENDEGSFIIDGNAPVSFDHVEGLITVNGPAGNGLAVIVCGTNGQDSITLQGTGANAYTVSVNDGPVVQYTNSNAVTLQGKNGDDSLVVDVQVVALGVAITVDGGAPGASDSLVISGVNGVLDTPTWTPNAQNGGTFVIGGTTTTVTDVEVLTYDGELENETLTVVGTGGDDQFTHTPGTAPDRGTIQIDNLLAIRYTNLGVAGTVTADGVGGNDSLSVLGTNDGDNINVSFAGLNAIDVDVASALGIHVDVLSANIENYLIESAQNGFDDIFLDTPINAGGNFFVLGGGPTDTLHLNATAAIAAVTITTPSPTPPVGVFGRITGFGSAIDFGQIDGINYFGNGAETLTVNSGSGDDTVTVKRGTFGDQVTTGTLPVIEYTGVGSVVIDGGGGSDTILVSPTRLAGFVTSFTVNGDGAAPTDDVLRLLGTAGVDTVTSTATVVTFNGVNITLGGGLNELQIHTFESDDSITLGAITIPTTIDSGSGNDTVDVSGIAATTTITTGDGNDVITGGPNADLINSGAGNDTITSLGGNDTIFAGDGNDSAVGGPGADSFFGGVGSDIFVWNPGDGNDLVEGQEGTDVLVFNGAAAAEIFLLQAREVLPGTSQPARFRLFRNLGNIDMDVAGTEQIDLNTLGGADTVTVNDLTQTEVQVVNINLATAVGGAVPDAAADDLTVDGRAAPDNLTISLNAGVVKVAGLEYDVRIRTAEAGVDRLTVRGLEGNDTIKAVDGVEATIQITLDGGIGNDNLSADATLLGGAGNDFLTGGSGADSLSGGDGEDTFVGGGGADTIDGGNGFDTILIQGTTGNDRIDVTQTSATVLTYTVNAFTDTDTLVLNGTTRTVEEARIEAGDGDDILRVSWDDTLGVDGSVNSLRMNVIGGAQFTRDRLAVVDAGTGDLVLYRKGPSDDTGSVTVGPANAEPLEAVFQGIETTQPIAGAGGDVEVFQYDTREFNDAQTLATDLGAGTTQNIIATIDPGVDLTFGLPADQDFYKIQAQFTGTLDVQAFFRQINTVASGRPGLPGNGNLDITVLDAAGNVIGGTAQPFGENDGTREFSANGNDERVRIPVVAGRVYTVRVFAANSTAGVAVNQYTLNAINTAAPVPYAIELQDGLNPLSGAQEVQTPAVVTNAAGYATVAFNSATNQFNLDVFMSGIGLNAASGLPVLQAMHFHRGAAGTNGPVIVDLLALGSFVQEPNGIRLRLNAANFPVAEVANLQAGNVYLNVHTTAFPNGELRAQVLNIQELSDSGRTQFDNHTRDNTPTLLFRLDDATFLNDLPGNDATGTPPDQLTSIPFQTGVVAGYRIAIFDEGSTPNTNLPQTPLGFATMLAPGLYTFTSPLLADGSHFLTARVQMIDPATPTVTGFGARSLTAEIVVDTVNPPISFGTAASTVDGLAQTSDSGVLGNAPTNVDRVTNDTTPTFEGFAEANSIIRLFLDLNNNGQADATDLLLGQTVATPLDGTNAFPNGRWSITSTDLNNAGVGVDGTRRLLVTAEDLSGNVSAADSLRIFIDTQGPRVTDVRINGFPAFNLFGLKTGNLAQGPTPLVNGLLVSLQDQPNRDTTNFPSHVALDLAVASNPGQYIVRGDKTGIAPVTSVTVVNNTTVNGQVATATVLLSFAAPLADDRYTVTLADTIVDPAGNRLDGDSNAAQPLDTPNFPSGDGQPGTSFVARFTVDSRPEIGVACCGSVSVDLNGNGIADSTGVNNDSTNTDKTFRFGLSSDAVFSGRFAPAGATTQHGFDSLGAYGFANGAYRFLLDFNSDGVADITIVPGLQINGLPVSGNFSAGHAGTEIGVFDGNGRWYLDSNGDNNLTAADLVINNGLTGFPIVGDFDGNGQFDLATYRPDQDTFYFDLNPLGAARASRTLAWGVAGIVERPLAADMNSDGVTDLLLFAPQRAGTDPIGIAEWYVLQSLGTPTTGTINTLNHPFQPAPLGNDVFYKYGDDRSSPVVGNFDPPVSGPGGGTTAPAASDITQVYQHLLGRTADDGARTYWSGMLQIGQMSYREFIEQVLASDEYYNRNGGTPQSFVTALYTDLLGRAPGAAEVSAWVGTLAGASRVQVADALFGSTEARTSATSWVAQVYADAGRFANKVYQEILGRSTSDGEAANWARQIIDGSLTRQRLVEVVLQSNEANARTIQSYYQTYLGRSADAGALAFWQNTLAQGGRVEDILTAIVSSAEFYQKNNAVDRNGQIQALYQKVLGRTASEGELNMWQRTGTAVRDIAYAVVYGHEYRSQLVNSWYNEYLGRTADAGGIAFWIGVLDGGSTQQGVKQTLLGSDEFWRLATSST